MNKIFIKFSIINIFNETKFFCLRKTEMMESCTLIVSTIYGKTRIIQFTTSRLNVNIF